MFHNPKSFKEHFVKRISSMFGKSMDEASVSDLYATLASMITDHINSLWAHSNKVTLDYGDKVVYYFSLEFLVGKYLEKNLIYLGVRDICEEGLKMLDIDMNDLIDSEPEAGLGNGGLGRLAACFLDSMASMEISGNGCGIRYKHGLFQQKIIDGYQVELPDNWLREVNVWEIRKPEKSVVVKYYGNVRPETDGNGNTVFIHENYTPVRAVPFDIPVLGYKNETVNTLRLWSAEALEQEFDFASFSRGDYMNAMSRRYAIEAISEVLYPDDSNYQNRILRLKQQYFFVSAGLQSIVRRFKRKHDTLDNLADKVAVQINDTHPALAIPELMRILMDENGYSWDDAWRITTRTIAYTNHTILPEALERWPIDTFRELLPRIYMLVEEINRRFCEDLYRRYPGDDNRVGRMAILGDGNVRMAHLAVAGSFSINGVAAVHTELLKNSVMRDFYEFYPHKFNNKTNGITHRRWLLKSNPKLSELISESIGTRWITDPLQLKFLVKYEHDKGFTDKLASIKRHNKLRLCEYIKKTNGAIIDPDSIFDVQVKRIHAYKRQMLNGLHIMHLYNRICEDPNFDFTPRTYIIAGKAAPSYYFAKNVIKFLCELSKAIEKNPIASKKLKLVFLENYGIEMAEMIFPASDFSEQISTASKEASGTSNMKFMLNGAITIGTNDGANIEIREHVGDDNFILFGMSVEEVLETYANGGYHSAEYAAANPVISGLLSQLTDGTLFGHLPRDEFSNIMRAFIDYNDEFFTLRDFDDYARAQRDSDLIYRDKARLLSMSTRNIAMAGVFSSDNTIAQYAKDIWFHKQ
ncbi:MAG: glycogen/starch/alpha-glucan phosphorylase [Oscillospiraceae bacterium]|nr:glycogen/starch/alpha-glucan phosphorylase [Oscillospiraceae bacterium]